MVGYEQSVDACAVLLLQDDAAARVPLEQAYAEAERRGDTVAQQVLAALALLAVNVEFADFRNLAKWIARFQAGEAAAPALVRTVDRLRVDAARTLLPSLDHAFSYEDIIPNAAAERLFDALRLGQWPGGDEHMLLAKTLYDHYGMSRGEQRCDRLAALVMEHLGRGGVSIRWQGLWWVVQEAALDYWGRRVAADEAQRQLRALLEPGRGANEPSLAYGLAAIEMRHALREHDIAAQDRLFAEIDRLRVLLRPGQVPRGLHQQVVVLLRRQRFHAALDKVDLLLGVCADVEVPERDQGLYHEQRAYALAGLQRWDEALAEVAALRDQQSGTQGEMVEALSLSLQAAAAAERAQPDAREVALAAVRKVASLNWRRFLWAFPRHAARLAEIGLDADVETEFLNSVIVERRMVPNDRHRSHWPWRLKVHVLGAMHIERDGRLLASGAKSQRKPLELLRLLAAHGGHPLDGDAVIDELWPSLEAHAPKASLEMAVSRLRKLLELPEAVVVADGLLSLHGELVWTDVAAFEARCDAADQGDADAAEVALALYRDKLFGSEELQGLQRASRQRLSMRYTRVVLDQGARLEAGGRIGAAQRLYEHGVAQDPLAEPLYRALMRVQLGRGERAEALRTFRRCRELLSEVLGTQPAAETLALAQRAQLPAD